MILDNTNRMFPVAQPNSFLRRHRLPGALGGLSAIGDETSFFGMTTQEITQLIAGLNSQQLFQMNLQRAQQGLPPLNPAQYAPAMNFGMTPETQKLVMIGIVAVVAVMMLKKA